MDISASENSTNAYMIVTLPRFYITVFYNNAMGKSNCVNKLKASFKPQFRPSVVYI